MIIFSALYTFAHKYFSSDCTMLSPYLIKCYKSKPIMYRKLLQAVMSHLYLYSEMHQLETPRHSCFGRSFLSETVSSLCVYTNAIMISTWLILHNYAYEICTNIVIQIQTQ